MRSRLIISCLFVAILSTRASAQFIHVDSRATGANNGSSWTDAYQSLATALNAAGNGPAIVIVARGTYPGGLQLRGTVSLYGAFAGLSAPDPYARDLAFPTILNGGTPVLNASTAIGAVLDGIRLQS